MSAASTLCASFMVPLLVLVYIESTYSSEESIQLDYAALFITLALIAHDWPLRVNKKRRSDTILCEEWSLWRGSASRCTWWRECEKCGLLSSMVRAQLCQ